MAQVFAYRRIRCLDRIMYFAPFVSNFGRLQPWGIFC
jgi:hypothetical protein